MTMKTTKVNGYINFFKDRKGMVLFEFMIVCFAAFVLVIFMIELGFVLRSEALLAGVTKNAARKIEVNGKLSNGDIEDIKNKLSGFGIYGFGGDFDVSDESYGEIILKVKYYGSDAYVDWPLTSDIGFRQNFKIYIKGYHKFNIGGLFGDGVYVPLVFAANGKVERFKF